MNLEELGRTKDVLMDLMQGSGCDIPLKEGIVVLLVEFK